MFAKQLCPSGLVEDPRAGMFFDPTSASFSLLVQNARKEKNSYIYSSK